ncbi:hypothetical protein L596_017322 [Steinernema carpocapsae]|uniref:SKP1 component POZ domain-containing protein n=1 Tax=Steinernema carpocapsae TaxID=34508 RepID=A0A4U5N1I1_STECR|nr:hypothetical protein L596_017322 [Steinernema carpocapsae]
MTSSSSQTIKVISSDGNSFSLKKEFLEKASTLKQMLSDLGFSEENGNFPEEGIPLPSVKGETLEWIVKWLTIHETEEPKTEDQLEMNRFNVKVQKENVALFDQCFPRKKLAYVISAAYKLKMPDLIDTLVKYTVKTLKAENAGKLPESFEQIYERKKKAEDECEEGSKGKERADA